MGRDIVFNLKPFTFDVSCAPQRVCHESTSAGPLSGSHERTRPSSLRILLNSHVSADAQDIPDASTDDFQAFLDQYFEAGERLANSME